MVIAINYGHVRKSDRLDGHIQRQLSRLLASFGERLTRVEVHLEDGGGTRSGMVDKRCVIEARPKGMDPVAVEAHAASPFSATTSASGKLRRMLEKKLKRA